MKTNSILVALLITTLGFTACSNEDDVNNSRKELKIETTIDGVGNSNLKAVLNTDGSGSFDNGDIIYLEAYTSESGVTMGGSYAIGVETLYWDSYIQQLGSHEFDFSACYPSGFMSDLKDEGFNAATAANPDLLIARTKAREGETVKLKFSHVMNKVVVKLSSNIYPTPQLETASVSLKGLKSIAKFDNSYKVDLARSTGSDAYSPAIGAQTSFIVAPQTLTEGTALLEISLGASKYIYKVPTTLTKLESGKILTFNLSISRDKVVLETNSISEWDDQGQIDDNIVANN
ncbi:MAG: fimbrillin family protein [Dysgonomonas sp.]